MRNEFRVYGVVVISLGGMVLFALSMLFAAFYVFPDSTTHKVMEWVFAIATNLAAVMFTISTIGLIYIAWRSFQKQSLINPLGMQNGAYFLSDLPHDKSTALLYLQDGEASGLTLQQANSQPISILPFSTRNALLDFPAPVQARDEQLLDVFFNSQRGEQ